MWFQFPTNCTQFGFNKKIERDGMFFGVNYREEFVSFSFSIIKITKVQNAKKMTGEKKATAQCTMKSTK